MTRTSWEVGSDYRGILVTGPAGRRFKEFLGLRQKLGKRQADNYHEGEGSKAKTRLQQRSGMYIYYTKHHKTSVLFWLRGYFPRLKLFRVDQTILKRLLVDPLTLTMLVNSFSTIPKRIFANNPYICMRAHVSITHRVKRPSSVASASCTPWP